MTQLIPGAPPSLDAHLPISEVPGQGPLPAPFAFDYGRMLGDFTADAVYQHPFEVTIDAAIVGPYMASFLDATPLWSSDRFARAMHLPHRPVPPHLLLNLGLSFSVHDISQQAIAHLAYVRVAFPKPLLLGQTVRAASRVIGSKATSAGDRGVVHVHTVLTDEHGERVLDFERKALIRGGNLTTRPDLPSETMGSPRAAEWMGHLPARDFAAALTEREIDRHAFSPKLWGRFEDFAEGQTLLHAGGRTVGESEHMQLAALCRNTHPLHWDEVYCQSHSFKKVRVVYGGLVLAWTLTQASLDLGGHLLWEASWSDGAHPNPVLAGDTIFAATRVLACRPLSERVGLVSLRMVGIKNRRPADLLAEGKELFEPEQGRASDAKIPEKVVEITRDILVRRHS